MKTARYKSSMYSLHLFFLSFSKVENNTYKIYILPFLKEKTINVHKIYMGKNMSRGNSQHKINTYACIFKERMWKIKKQVTVVPSQKGRGMDEGQKWGSFLCSPFMDLFNFVPYDNENKLQNNCSEFCI